MVVAAGQVVRVAGVEAARDDGEAPAHAASLPGTSLGHGEAADSRLSQAGTAAVSGSCCAGSGSSLQLHSIHLVTPKSTRRPFLLLLLFYVFDTKYTFAGRM